MYAILDLDNGLADSAHRETLVAKEPKNWDAYYSAEKLSKDAEVPGMKALISRLKELRYELIVLSTRPESLREATRSWLFDTYNLSLAEERIVLRTGGNMLTAGEYKAQQLVELRTRLEKRDDFIIFTSDSAAVESLKLIGLVLKVPDCLGSLF